MSTSVVESEAQGANVPNVSEASASVPTLSSLIPTGPWTLYFHSPEETKWTLQTFMKLGTFTTWEQFWSLMEVLQTECFMEGLFFLMRDSFLPLWEHHHHIRGGCYSIRSQKRDTTDGFVTYMVAAMLGVCATHPDNKINGVTVCPKRGFNIIKLWNGDAQRFHHPSNLNLAVGTARESEIIYTQFLEKKM